MTSTINKKKSKRNKKNEDKISGLHEDVLSHILSLMPMKFAEQTSILSRRWRYTWMSVYNIYFNDIRPIHNKDCFFWNLWIGCWLSVNPKLKFFCWTSPNAQFQSWLNNESFFFDNFNVSFSPCLTCSLLFI